VSIDSFSQSRGHPLFFYSAENPRQYTIPDLATAKDLTPIVYLGNSALSSLVFSVRGTSEELEARPSRYRGLTLLLLTLVPFMFPSICQKKTEKVKNRVRTPVERWLARLILGFSLVFDLSSELLCRRVQTHVKQPLLGLGSLVPVCLVEGAWCRGPVSKYSLKSIRLVAIVYYYYTVFFWKRAMEEGPTPAVL
jgi:hypothetical protein